jgi:hypothetical protein
MTTYQTPGELGVSFYNGSKTYSGASAPEWAVDLIENKTFESTGAYASGNKDCLNLVGTSENEIVFASTILSPYVRNGNIEELQDYFRVDESEQQDKDDQTYIRNFLKTMCPDHYEETISSLSQDDEITSDGINAYLTKNGSPTGMKYVYYEREIGNDAYAGVLIHSANKPFAVSKIASVESEVQGYYDLYGAQGTNTYDNPFYDQKN